MEFTDESLALIQRAVRTYLATVRVSGETSEINLSKVVLNSMYGKTGVVPPPEVLWANVTIHPQGGTSFNVTYNGVYCGIYTQEDTNYLAITPSDNRRVWGTAKAAMEWLIDKKFS